MRPAVIGIPIGHRHSKRDAEPVFGINTAYCRAVEAAGGVPLLIPLLDAAAVDHLFGLCDGLLLAGGGDVAPENYGCSDGALASGVDPQRDRVELALAQRAMGQMPVLGICRGIQVLNVAAGGTLIVDIPTAIGGSIPHQTPKPLPPSTRRHGVELLPGSLLARTLESDRQGPRLAVNSTHHQAVETLAPGFVTVAVAEDGVIEGIECPHFATFFLGVQWHPERLAAHDPQMARLFECLVEACDS